MNAPTPVQNSMKKGSWIPSTCKMCLHSCNTLVHVTDEGIVNKVEGNPSSPSNQGRLCPKGNCALLRLYDPQRIKTPLKRTNPKKGPNEDPKWVPVSWEEAFDTVARELKRTLDEDPRKLLPAINDFQKLFLWAWPAAFGGNANYFTVVGTFCGAGYHPMNGMIHRSFAAGNDYDYCKYWINIGGGDGFSSHLHVASSIKNMADLRVDKGTHVVVVEPRLSIGGAKADEWIPIRPATDRQFALGLAYVLIHEGLFDETFIKNETNAVYLVRPDGYFARDKNGRCLVFDEADKRIKPYNDKGLKSCALKGTYELEGILLTPAFEKFREILKSCTPQKMSRITTVPAETIERIARELAEAAQIGSSITIEGRVLPFRPAGLNYYRGAQGRKYGSMTNHAFKLVNMLLGNIDTPGGHIGFTLDDFYEDFNRVTDDGPWWPKSENENGMMDPAPHQLHPEVPFSYPPRTTHLMEFFPLGVDPGHLNNLTLFDPEKFGLDFYPDTMLICHSNPIWNMPGNQDRWFELMTRMRFIVAIDILENESNIFADILLPAHDTLESWNMTMIEPTNTEGMCLRQPAIDPLHDSKSEEEIFWEISKRIGILKEWNQVVNFVLRFDKKPELMLKEDETYSDKDIAERRGLIWNGKDLNWYKEKGHAITKRRPDKYYRPWEGLRLHFYLEYIIEQKDRLKRRMEEAKVPYLSQWHWNDYQPLPLPILDPIHEEPQRFDLYAITFKDVQLNFTENLSIPWIDDIVFKDPVHMGILINPVTAMERGIEIDDLIEVVSPYGQIKGIAKISEGVHPDTVAVSNALTRWGKFHAVIRPGGGNFNRLLPANLENTDACSGQPETSARVRVRKLSSKPKDAQAVLVKNTMFPGNR